MIKNLTRVGTSQALIISKEMKAHLGVTGDQIEVQYHDGRIVLTRARSLEEAVDATFEQYGTALRNLAK